MAEAWVTVSAFILGQWCQVMREAQRAHKEKLPYDTHRWHEIVALGEHLGGAMVVGLLTGEMVVDDQGNTRLGMRDVHDETADTDATKVHLPEGG